MVITSLAPILVVGMAGPTEKSIKQVGSNNFEKYIDHISGSGTG